MLQGIKILSSGMKELKSAVESLQDQVQRLHGRMDSLETTTPSTSNPNLDELIRVVQELLGTQSKISAQLSQSRDGRVGINVPTLTMSSVLVPERRKEVGPSQRDIVDAGPSSAKFPSL